MLTWLRHRLRKWLGVEHLQTSVGHLIEAEKAAAEQVANLSVKVGYALGDTETIERLDYLEAQLKYLPERLVVGLDRNTVYIIQVPEAVAPPQVDDLRKALENRGIAAVVVAAKKVTAVKLS